VAEKRLSDRHIIQNLQYVLAKIAGEAIDLSAANALLVERNIELSSKLRAAPKSNEPKLTPSDVRRIRTEYATGRFRQSEIASWYDLNRATVSRIVRNKYHTRIR
jgi:hypothetical protein